jgi:hypothetical protein
MVGEIARGIADLPDTEITDLKCTPESLSSFSPGVLSSTGTLDQSATVKGLAG